RAELRAEQGTGRADLEACSVRAVLADVRGHQPAHAIALLIGAEPRLVDQLIQRSALRERAARAVEAHLLALLDEGDVPPGVGVAAGVAWGVSWGGNGAARQPARRGAPTGPGAGAPGARGRSGASGTGVPGWQPARCTPAWRRTRACSRGATRRWPKG